MLPYGSRKASPSLSPISEASAEDAVIPPLSLVAGHIHQYADSSNAEYPRDGESSQASLNRPKSALDSVVRGSVGELMNTINNNQSNGGVQNHMSQARVGPSLDSLVRSSGYRPLSESDVLDMLEYDERPSFLIDLLNAVTTTGNLNILYANKSLQKHKETFDQLLGHTAFRESPGTSHRFMRWVTGVPSAAEAASTPRGAILFANFKWTSTAVQRTLKICRGYTEAQRPFTPRSQPPSPGFGLTSSTKENEKTPTRELSDYFGPPEASESRHVRNRSSDHRTKDKLGNSRRDSRTYPQRERSSSASKRSSGSFNNGNDMKAQVVSETEARALESPSSQIFNHDLFRDLQRANAWNDEVERKLSFDFTQLANISHLSNHTQFIRNSPWDLNILGPMSEWSPALRQCVNMIIACPHPAALYWGDSLIVMYNEAYVDIAGPKHPFLMGKAYSDGWSEIWEAIKPMMNNALYKAESVSKKCDQLSINRYGTKFEECYFDWAIIPVLGSDGSVVGLYNPCFEQTRQVISERQTATLRSISEHTADVMDTRDFWRGVVRGLATNPYDIPFAMAFSASQEVDSDSSRSSKYSGTGNSIICTLEEQVGVPPRHAILPTSPVELLISRSPAAELMRKAIERDEPLYLSIDDGSLPRSLLEGITCLVWETDECRAIVVCSIYVGQRTDPMGFLITGVNSRRPYNEEYHRYMIQLKRQIETALASVILVQDEIAKSQKAARLAAEQQDQLTRQLKSTSEKANQSEVRFNILTRLNPTGLFIADPSGQLTYCNPSFYTTMGVDEEDTEDGLWMRNVTAEDKVELIECWQELINDRVELDLEIRLDIPWSSSSGRLEKTYVVVKAKLELSEDGVTVRSILGCIIDISQPKWAELVESKRKEDAMIRKQEQEQFIDMTSHEMRNPLSSILQCADEVARNAAELALSRNLTGLELRKVEELALVSNTLSLCGQHEKRIVDDILTLSKMEAGKLKVSPGSVDARELIEVAKTMFKYDIKYFDIELVVRVDKSYEQLGVKWVNVDPSRVLAVLVNLTTNSIKFTAKEKKRCITITLSASSQPFADSTALKFVEKSEKFNDPTDEPEWGTGDAVYLHFSVSDTGKGLSKEELKNLFQRFAQASDRTHVAYGGSGLGLFIARLLSEIQGGQIGVASTPGVGSTFAFYIKAKRTTVAPASQIKAELVKPKDEIHILLVEDNTIVAATAARSLKSNGCVVHLAGDGLECLEHLRRSQYYGKRNANDPSNIRVDVVLMDQQMPRMDGLECAKEIRKQTEEGKFIGHIPIIGTTGNARAEQLELVLAAGMDSIVTKPFTISELFPEVSKVMGKHPGPPLAK